MNAFLYPGDTYHSPSAQVGLFARLFPSCSFYARVVSIICYEGKKAKNSAYTGDDWANASLKILHALEDVGVTFHLEGMETMNQVNGPCVFIGNHMSTLEAFILPALIQPRKDATFVVKQSLIDFPVFKHVLRSRAPITVGRKNPREDLQAVLQGGEERLKAGRSVIIFPQSTRSSALDIENFNSIGVKLARRAGVPIIPIAIRSDAWSPGALLKDFGKVYPHIPVHFTFGTPLTVTGNGKEEHRQVCSFISEHLAAWQLAVAPL